MRTTSQRRVRQLHELLKPASHSTKCTSDAPWTPSPWTGARGARMCVRRRSRRRVCRAPARFTKPATPYKFSACMHSRVFPCPYHLSQGRPSMFLRPGHDLRSSFYPKRQRRGSPSMLFWVKFIYTAGVSLLCVMVVKRGTSEGLSLIYTHSSINAFFKASLIGIYFTNN